MKSFYTITEEVPSKLEDGDFVVRPLDFLEEISVCQRLKPSANIMAPNYLRSIAVEVGNRYDRLFNPYTQIVPSDYSGIRFTSDKDIATVVKAMFDATYPKIYKAYLCTRIISRPYDCKRIIIIGKEAQIRPIVEAMGLEKYIPQKIVAKTEEIVNIVNIVNTVNDTDLEFLANTTQPIVTKKSLKKNK